MIAALPTRTILSIVITTLVTITAWIWALGPVRTAPDEVSTQQPTFTEVQHPTAEQHDAPADGRTFVDMVLWTKPPPVVAEVTPPPPPPPLRLNAELLAVRASSDGHPEVAVLYLIETGQVLRLSAGDEVAGMTVASIDADGIVLQRAKQTLKITRRRE